MAVETLWSNKIRSGLTMLGVIIGISSVIAITSIGQGVQRATELRIEALGTNILPVSAAAARTGGISQGAGSASTLLPETARRYLEHALAEPLRGLDGILALNALNQKVNFSAAQLIDEAIYR
jgi:putative ABC transport system permease protein